MSLQIQNSIKKSITRLVKQQVTMDVIRYDEKRNDIIDALHILLNGDFVKYHFNSTDFSSDFINEMSSDGFQSTLSKINEKQSIRKQRGVYYTPKDVTYYLISNVFVNIIDANNTSVYSYEDCLNYIVNQNAENILKILSSSIFDPTSGAGEFLVSALELKLEILEKTRTCSDKDYIDVISYIYGNDINPESNEIAKIRLFFSIIDKIKDSSNYSVIANILKQNFYCVDFVSNLSINQKFDIIIGNPPYVEYGKLDVVPNNKYGNIYADVLHNSSLLLNNNGVMSFVIPISYVSTSRMGKIRAFLLGHTPKQFVLNYADRPDCLFTSVHQKLTLLIACKNNQKPQVYSSGYTYWYKSERNELLNGREIIGSKSINAEYIPKIGCNIEQSIYEKALATKTEQTFLSINSNLNSGKLYLNMRGCFWIKAFSFNPGSSEYKEFGYDQELQPYILCLLNSSLFFLFWIMVSDCWHITNKELSSFRVITNHNMMPEFKIMAERLENKLEETKKYIGTKQVEYAYKHKFCKQEIDEIDDLISKIYCLTTEELEYVKSYNLKYRMSDK